MRYLENVIYPPKDSEEDETRGRLRELKAYMLESDRPLHSNFVIDAERYEIIDTGLEKMKILRVLGNGTFHEFFLDVADSRFYVLHTNERSDDASKIVSQLVRSRDQMLDYAWFHSELLKGILKKAGNAFRGFGVSYSNKFATPDDEDYLSLSVKGTPAGSMWDAIESKTDTRKRMALNSISVMRGQPHKLYDFVQDDIANNGYFAVKRGKSVQDHLDLVKVCRGEYRQAIEGVESLRIRVRNENGASWFEGHTFDFVFPSPMQDIGAFVEQVFNSSTPFRLWGIREKVDEDHMRVMAVDLHVGHPADFEISRNVMRVYLYKESCGNIILRLLTNLQTHYDSRISCEEIS